MAKSIRSKQRRKMRAIKRESYAKKELDMLKKVVATRTVAEDKEMKEEPRIKNDGSKTCLRKFNSRVILPHSLDWGSIALFVRSSDFYCICNRFLNFYLRECVYDYVFDMLLLCDDQYNLPFR